MSTEDDLLSQDVLPDVELDDVDQLLVDAVGDTGFNPALDDAPCVGILSEYLESVDPELFRVGWSMQNAKSAQYPYYKYDQSMLVHTRTGVFFLLRFLGDVLPDDRITRHGDRETTIREILALFVVHDIHKTIDSEGYHDEFDITKTDVEEFVSDIGVDDFAPTLSTEDFHAVVVGLHKTDNAKHEMLTKRFLNLNQYLRLADGIASLSDPEDWVTPRLQRSFENAIGTEFTPHSHAVEGEGALTSVINKAAAETFQSYGYSLLTIHDDGCTYATDDGPEIGDLPDDTDEFLDELYHNFLQELRPSFSRYQNRSFLSEAAELVDGQGRYHISDLDVLCLPPPDLIRAIIEHGIDHSERSYDLPNYTKSALDALHEETGVEFDRTYRIEGVARFVHTIFDSIIPGITDEDAERGWKRDETAAALAVFEVSYEMQQTIADVYQDPSDGLIAESSTWPYKYLIAQDIIEREKYFVGESANETIETLTDDVLSELNDFPHWDSYRENRIGNIDAELRALLFSRLRYDGEPLSDAGLPSAVDSYILKSKSECGLCSGPTTARQQEQPNLIEAPLSVEVGESTFENIEVDCGGEIVELQQKCYDSPLCYACQLDVELQAADDSWGSDDSYLHVAVQPEYAYTPLSGLIFSNILDTYSGVSAKRGEQFSKDVFTGHSDVESAYDNWMSDYAQHSFGQKMLADIERGFMLGAGYGGHTVSFPLQDGDALEAIFTGSFAASVATTYSGLSAYISTHPILRVPDRDTKKLLRFGPEMDELRPVFGGRSLPLHRMEDVLKATSAIRRLGLATGHGHAPVNAYCAYWRNKSFPLVGSQMLSNVVENDEDPMEYADEAVHLDGHAATEDLMAFDFVRDARILGDYAINVLEFTEDAELVRSLVEGALEIVVEHGERMDSEDLANRIIQFVENHESVNPDAFETMRGFIVEFAYVLAEESFEKRHGASSATMAAAKESICDGVWAHALAVSSGERETKI